MLIFSPIIAVVNLLVSLVVGMGLRILIMAVSSVAVLLFLAWMMGRGG